MKSYIAFTKKELMESNRTYKTAIMMIVFLMLALLSVFTAKFMPELLRFIANIDAESIGVGNPSMIDCWVQFFKNITTIGLIVMVIIFSNTLIKEFASGTLINILTKGIKRSTVLLAKMSALSLIWTISYLLCIVVNYFYTSYYFEINEMHNIFISFFSFWLYGELLISLIIFGSILFKNIYGSLLTPGAFVVITSIIGMIPKLKKYSPKALVTFNIELISGIKDATYIIPAITITLMLIITLLLFSIKIFNNKQF